MSQFAVLMDQEPIVVLITHTHIFIEQGSILKCIQGAVDQDEFFQLFTTIFIAPLSLNVPPRNVVKKGYLKPRYPK